jgi:DNA mismatch repair protein MutL
MKDIIKLLPDSVANQIAAGEVIQRPASAVKEMLENAIDAGATRIDLILRDAGKSLIQVTDNGCGMSETDARMSFERHATSKISKADDLFAIRTMGFRGEALASIAAIAQVELKTRRHEDELATLLRIEGSVVQSQEVCPAPAGSTLTVKNLFYNVPARRNFLKTPQAEMRHIIEEFQRVSLIHPEISFTMSHNDKEMFHLYSGPLKQRISSLLGAHFNERLLLVSQHTELVKIDGYVVKAEFSRKTRGEQYFFVNKRFIKHPYLHHAVENAFQELLPRDTYPSYFLHIQIDPAEIDINIHPTKTEVNFQDTKLVYALIHAAVKKAIGQHNLSPRLDFDSDTDHGIDFGDISRASRAVQSPSITVNPDFNPFERDQRNTSDWKKPEKANPTENWRIFHESPTLKQPTQEIIFSQQEPERESKTSFLQLHGAYILTPVKSGLMLIDQHLAHWRILFEKFLLQMEARQLPSQQELFPQTIHLSAADASLITELQPELKALGFSIEAIGTRTFVVSGMPEGLRERDASVLIDEILDAYNRNLQDLHIEKRQKLSMAMSLQMSIKPGQQLSVAEMSKLIDQLFACQIVETAPDGRKILTVIPLNDLISNF